MRTDKENQRLFVQVSEADIGDLAIARRVIADVGTYIAKCRKNWDRAWSISFFSARKYAGYKDETEIRQYVETGQWEKAYLAEYDNADRTLTRYPLQPGKRTESGLDDQD